VKDRESSRVVVTTMPKPLEAGTLAALSLAACRLPSADLGAIEPAESGARALPVEQEPLPRAKPRGRPEVVDAELVSGDLLRLTFSEPLAPLDAVDPNDFRLSVGMAKSYRTYAYAYYYDLADAVDGELPFLELRDMTMVDPRVLELHLEPDFDLAVCHELLAELAMMTSEPGIQVRGGVSLHYLPSKAAIEDLDGNPLAPMGSDWLLARRSGGEDAYELYFMGPAARRALRDVVPVRCAPAPPAPTPPPTTPSPTTPSPTTPSPTTPSP
jgi:hypothetical protein